MGSFSGLSVGGCERDTLFTLVWAAVRADVAVAGMIATSNFAASVKAIDRLSIHNAVEPLPLAAFPALNSRIL